MTPDTPLRASSRVCTTVQEGAAFLPAPSTPIARLSGKPVLPKQQPDTFTPDTCAKNQPGLSLPHFNDRTAAEPSLARCQRRAPSGFQFNPQKERR
jgi:hypothetical protein